ncbi:MAG: hypothetical protein H0X17_12035 [Deltaproteobacteria bacterium]|nr:hypothetical protein [Deltaproteobacteria bacterium]
MRSWRDALTGARVLAVAVSMAVTMGACGNDRGLQGGGDDTWEPPDEDACKTSFLDYDNFGAPFVVNWCRGCHSSAVPAGMRQRAPIDINFDDADDVRMWSERIAVRAASAAPTMPPAGGPSEEERKLLVEWIACGAK